MGPEEIYRNTSSSVRSGQEILSELWRIAYRDVSACRLALNQQKWDQVADSAIRLQILFATLSDLLPQGDSFNGLRAVFAGCWRASVQVGIEHKIEALDRIESVLLSWNRFFRTETVKNEEQLITP